MMNSANARRPLIDGPVLVDGLWDNPNYWLRLTLLRAALGFNGSGREIGLIGGSRQKMVRTTFRRFDVESVIVFDDFLPPPDRTRNEVDALLRHTRVPDDILSWRLPFDYPSSFVYDFILKRQHSKTVDLEDPKLPSIVTEALRSLYAADVILQTRDFKLVVLSHGLNMTYGAIAWRAVQLDIPTVVLYGDFGLNRFWRITKTKGFFERLSRSRDCMARVFPDQTESLVEIGQEALARRRNGQTRDISGVAAFNQGLRKITRNDIVRHFGWQAGQPIIAVYSSNWFDFPHAMGMSNFRDYWDWLQSTVMVARDSTHVNWLFKGHPTEYWYGGQTFAEVMEPEVGADAGHIGVAPIEWNSAAIQDSIDGLITHHSSSAIEVAAMGKPVLVADRGWYHECGFVKWPGDRRAYLDTLGTDWWRDVDTDTAALMAQRFAGWLYGCPAWQSGFIPGHDIQDDHYEAVCNLLARPNGAMEREITEIRRWYESGQPHLHDFKMCSASDYIVPET